MNTNKWPKRLALTGAIMLALSLGVMWSSYDEMTDILDPGQNHLLELEEGEIENVNLSKNTSYLIFRLSNAPVDCQIIENHTGTEVSIGDPSLFQTDRDGENGRYREGHRRHPQQEYGRSKVDAENAVAATEKAGVTLGLGYNRRLHPEITKLRERINSGELGVILHCEANMTFPNALFLSGDAWRANREETPCGGLTPMGVHAIDGMIDLCGEIDEVYCQSFRRAVEVDADDTTSILFRMKEGMSGYLSTMTATGGGFSFQVFGSKGHVRLEGMTHIAGAPSEERRKKCFGNCYFKPIKGPLEHWQAEETDIVKAALERFSDAVNGTQPFMIPTSEMVHGVAVTEAVVRSAGSHQVEKVI